MNFAKDPMITESKTASIGDCHNFFCINHVIPAIVRYAVRTAGVGIAVIKEINNPPVIAQMKTLLSLSEIPQEIMDNKTMSALPLNILRRLTATVCKTERMSITGIDRILDNIFIEKVLELMVEYLLF